MNKQQEETRVEFSEQYENKGKSVFIRPTSHIYTSLCKTLCDTCLTKQKWAYVWVHGTILAFDLSLFRQTGGQAIPDKQQ